MDTLDLSSLRPDDLGHLDDEQMKLVVDADLRRHANRRPQLPMKVSAALRSPEYIDRWYTALARTAASVDGQLDMRTADFESDEASIRRDIMKAEFEFEQARAARQDTSALQQELNKLRVQNEDLRAQYLRKRASMLRFKSGVDETLVECNSLRDTYLGSGRNWMQEARRLRDAIVRHRDAMKAEDIEASSIDEELWRAIAEGESK